MTALSFHCLPGEGNRKKKIPLGEKSKFQWDSTLWSFCKVNGQYEKWYVWKLKTFVFTCIYENKYVSDLVSMVTMTEIKQTDTNDDLFSYSTPF